MNRRILDLDDAPPFLRAFIEPGGLCRVGVRPGRRAARRAAWTSATDGRRWTFSAFAYIFLSLDFELDEFITGVPFLVRTGQGAIPRSATAPAIDDRVPLGRAQSGNDEILEPPNRCSECSIFGRSTPISRLGASGELRRHFSAPRFFPPLSAAGLMHRMTHVVLCRSRRRSFPQAHGDPARLWTRCASRCLQRKGNTAYHKKVSGAGILP